MVLSNITWLLIVDNTKILKRNADVNRLQISEAITKVTNPTINRQLRHRNYSDDRSKHEPNLSNIQNIQSNKQTLIINNMVGTIRNDDTNTHTLRRSARLN